MDMTQRIINVIFVIEHLVLASVLISYAVYWMETRTTRRQKRFLRDFARKHYARKED